MHDEDRKDDPLALALGRAMLQSVRGVACLFIDGAGIITHWSAGAANMTSWQAEEAIGKHIEFLFTPEDRLHAVAELELRTALELGSSNDDRWHCRKDGSRFWANGVTVPAADTNGFVKIFRVVTHLRARAAIRENEVDELRKERADKDRLLALVAHELRNPLAPIRTACDILQRQLDQAHARPLAILIRQVEMLDRLVEDLVDASRVRVGKLALSYAPVLLQDLLSSALESCQEAAAEKEVELRVLLPAAPIEAEVDAARIHQVVVNLLRNAIKFTPAQGWVALLATVDGDHLTIQVRDNGQGIDSDLMPRIFDMFTQAAGAGSARGAGLGVGLAVAKEIIVLHRGSIEVRSEGVGRGSEFAVRLPLRPPAD